MEAMMLAPGSLMSRMTAVFLLKTPPSMLVETSMLLVTVAVACATRRVTLLETVPTVREALTTVLVSAVASKVRKLLAILLEPFTDIPKGHMKSECTNAPIDRPFDGECRQCGASGHRAADCDQKPCKACGVPGHTTEACEVNRMHAMFADMKIEEVSAEVAWENILTADKEKDVDDIRRAVFAYAKAYPELTLVELEATFRGADFNTYLIAKEQEVSDTHTIVNFQGQPGQKYVLSFQFSPRPRRVKFAEGWPETPEDNIERLAEAGVVMDGFVQKCRNCEQVASSELFLPARMILTFCRAMSPPLARRRSVKSSTTSTAPTVRAILTALVTAPSHASPHQKAAVTADRRSIWRRSVISLVRPRVSSASRAPRSVCF
jgi:hypothetical protein